MAPLLILLIAIVAIIPKGEAQDKFQKQLSSLMKSMKATQKTVTNLSARMERLESVVLQGDSKYPQAATMALGFSATHSGNLGSFPQPMVIQWEATITNEGGAWDGTRFTAPVAGLYAFHLRVHNRGSGNGDNTVYIARNGQAMLTTFTWPDTANNSGHVVLMLSELDFVEAYLGANSALKGNTPGVTRNHHFTGYLVGQSA